MLPLQFCMDPFAEMKSLVSPFKVFNFAHSVTFCFTGKRQIRIVCVLQVSTLIGTPVIAWIQEFISNHITYRGAERFWDSAFIIKYWPNEAPKCYLSKNSKIYSIDFEKLLEKGFFTQTSFSFPKYCLKRGGPKLCSAAAIGKKPFLSSSSVSLVP